MLILQPYTASFAVNFGRMSNEYSICNNSPCLLPTGVSNMPNRKERGTLHSVPEASQLSNVPSRTLYRAIKLRYLKSTDISGRPFVTLEDIEAWKASPYYMPHR